MGMLVSPYRHGGVAGASPDAGILAAVLFTVSGTTVTVVGQKNVASVQRLTTGIYRVNIASAFAHTNYGVMATARSPASAIDESMLVAPSRHSGLGNQYTTNTLDVGVQKAGGNFTNTDPVLCAVVIFDPQLVSASHYLAAASWTLSGTAITLQRQLNVASMTRPATGVYRTTFTSALATADYQEFGMSRYASGGNANIPICGHNRHTSRNAHSTSDLDLCAGLNNATSKGMFDTQRGSLLIGRANVVPAGTLARVRFTVSGGVCTIVEGYNVASVSYQAAGRFKINFSSPLVDTDYAVFGSGTWGAFTDDDTPLVSANNNTTASRAEYSTTAVDISAKSYTNNNFDGDAFNVWVVKPWLM